MPFNMRSFKKTKDLKNIYVWSEIQNMFHLKNKQSMKAQSQMKFFVSNLRIIRIRNIRGTNIGISKS